MIKLWMIIIISVIPITDGASREDFYAGSTFYSKEDCERAMAEVTERDRQSFCVETYVKGVFK